MRLAALPGLLALGRIFRHPMGRARGASLVLAFAVIAIFTPLIAPYDPALQDFDELMPPDPSHWLGTDQFGRDVLSRVLYASRWPSSWAASPPPSAARGGRCGASGFSPATSKAGSTLLPTVRRRPLTHDSDAPSCSGFLRTC